MPRWGYGGVRPRKHDNIIHAKATGKWYNRQVVTRFALAFALSAQLPRVGVPRNVPDQCFVEQHTPPKHPCTNTCSSGRRHRFSRAKPRKTVTRNLLRLPGLPNVSPCALTINDPNVNDEDATHSSRRDLRASSGASLPNLSTTSLEMSPSPLLSPSQHL